ncbi:diacylglycerol kinase family protein [Paenibacillus protaetiae]|uniref:Diacylglycerol kinase family protein n=1 Tax=Paenibacillus protaetiae TaxID=2509456 RepID=A0A4P6ET30_9BACL|nr:diacylglycerol kinase family protein [Paenibacillus protaetiae]QAY66300.1 diacylglycerol kinase family protein [Paenibacillus protaetiae]
MRKFIRSLGYACSGIQYALRTQRHMRIHTAAAVIVIFLGLIARLTVTRWAILLLTIGSVISAEMMNTAVEQVVNLASPSLHPLAKRAKDVAAGAVLIVSAAAVVIGVIVLLPPIWELLFQ